MISAKLFDIDTPEYNGQVHVQYWKRKLSLEIISARTVDDDIDVWDLLPPDIREYIADDIGRGTLLEGGSNE